MTFKSFNTLSGTKYSNIPTVFLIYVTDLFSFSISFICFSDKIIETPTYNKESKRAALNPPKTIPKIRSNPLKELFLKRLVICELIIVIITKIETATVADPTTPATISLLKTPLNKLFIGTKAYKAPMPAKIHEEMQSNSQTSPR